MAVRRSLAIPRRNVPLLKPDSPIAEVLFVGHWLDALAKASTGHRARHRTGGSGTESPPESGRPVEISPAPKAQGLTRRALLRRGAVVGAVVWTTPILQTALAPAASASHCTSSCPLGSPCSPLISCQAGLVCTGGFCLVATGSGGCTTNADCASGACSGGTCLSWPGATCTANSQCASNKCAGGQCFANGLNGACRTTTDCTDNTTCSATTQTCGGVGAACANNNKCTTNKCQGGICVP